MPPQDLCPLLFGALGTALIAGLGAWLWRRGRARRGRAVESELEGLRDEIWELRAAAAARDRAEAASQAKSRFLATVSHEIRTPLNGVLGLAQLLAATRLDAEQASYVDAIAASGRSLAQLIDDILDFSKIEAGRIELRVESFALAPLVEGVVELLAPRAEAKGLEIASHIAPSAPERMEGDAARVRQVLVNLAGNAVNFTSRGGVGLQVERDGDGAVAFRVADTGPGVAPAAREIIFEEFEQGDASSTRRHGGTGLGLAISRHLAMLMGGRLEVEDRAGEGSVFVFTLPRGPNVAFDAGRGEPARLDGARVLIASPTIFEGAYIAMTLRDAGATAHIARDEAQCEQWLSGATPAAFETVIVDCALGALATERLAETARRAGAARVFLLFSPMERRAFGEAALRQFDGWLVKPVRAASLIERVSAAPPPPIRNEVDFVAPTPILSDLHILVAEDNEINALIVRRHLEKLGATATRAENGARAVALAEAALAGRGRPFDLILMDLFMPELDGLEATRAIRTEEARMGAPRRPIIALTASALEQDEHAARGAGVDALLTKPVEFAALSAAIDAALAAHPSRAARAGAAR